VHDPGVYAVQVVDANGCMDTALAMVDTMFCRCTVDFGQVAQCYQDPVPFTLIADSTVLGAEWRFGSAASYSDEIDPVVQFVRGGDVVVTLRATLSCGVVEVVRAIHVPDCSDSCTVFVPNAFTPDGDSYNESWALGGECVPQEFKVAVFDRWGELIYTSTDPRKAWDGTVNGRLSPEGVYAYLMDYRLPYQEQKKARGFITLLR
jgi:gliding motility-associated-like protein